MEDNKNKKIDENTVFPVKVVFEPNGKTYTAIKFSKNGHNVLLQDSVVKRWEPYYLCEIAE